MHSFGCAFSFLVLLLIFQFSMKKSTLVIIPFLALQCQQAVSQNIEIVTDLPAEIKEASACETSIKSDLVWTIEDQKNAPILFGFNKQGDLIKKIAITNAENNDWEDLTSDSEGNIYIGDFGNNDNDRENLAIYKVNSSNLSTDQTAVESVVEFYYPEQKDFPPKKKELVYDSEAFFYYNNAFYLFTKNRSSKFDGTTALYRVNNIPGTKQAAEKIADFVTCDNFNGCAITGADISPDGKKVVLLGSDKLWLFTDFTDDKFFSGKSKLIELGHHSQKEGICFEDNNTLLITDESVKKQGSNLYRVKL